MKWARSYLCIGKEWPLLLALALGAPALIGVLLASAALNARAGDLTLFWLALASALIGITLLFIARIPLYRQRRFLVFGPKALPETHRRIYWIAYAFIIVSILTMLFLLAVLR